MAGEVADWQAAGPLKGRRQGVAGKTLQGRAVAGAVGKDAIEQPEGAGAGDALGQLLAQDGEIDAGKIKADVATEHPAMAAAFSHEAAQGLVAAETDAVGIAGGDEPLLQGWHDGSAKDVMHNAVAIGGGGDQAPFGFTDFELAVGPGCVGKRLQFVLQLKEIGLQLGVEGEHGRPIALALLGAQGGGMERGEAGEAGVELSERSLRHGGVQHAGAEAVG